MEVYIVRKTTLRGIHRYRLHKGRVLQERGSFGRLFDKGYSAQKLSSGARAEAFAGVGYDI